MVELTTKNWKDSLIFIGVLSGGLAGFVLFVAYFGQ